MEEQRIKQIASGTITAPPGSTTIDGRDTAHVWKPMLHTVAAGTSDLHREQVAFVAHAARHGFAYWPGEMDGIDRRRNAVSLAPLRLPDRQVLLGPREVVYDALVIAACRPAPSTGPRAPRC